MGQKVCPTGFRLGITENWKSRWYAKKNYAELLENDLKLRAFIEKTLSDAAVSKVDIERTGENVKITITTARPGVIIGKKGADIDVLRKKLQKIADGKVSVDVLEIRRPEIDANLISQSIGRTIPVMEVYRTLSNKNKEVLVRIAYNSNMAKEAAKKIVREDLEKKGDKLHKDLDKLLGW